MSNSTQAIDTPGTVERIMIDTFCKDNVVYTRYEKAGGIWDCDQPTAISRLTTWANAPCNKHRAQSKALNASLPSGEVKYNIIRRGVMTEDAARELKRSRQEQLRALDYTVIGR